MWKTFKKGFLFHLNWAFREAPSSQFCAAQWNLLNVWRYGHITPPSSKFSLHVPIYFNRSLCNWQIQARFSLHCIALVDSDGFTVQSSPLVKFNYVNVHNQPIQTLLCLWMEKSIFLCVPSHRYTTRLKTTVYSLTELLKFLINCLNIYSLPTSEPWRHTLFRPDYRAVLLDKTLMWPYL